VILARLELTILYSASIRLIHLGHRTTVNNLFKKKKKNYSDDWFRSSDFWVMGPTRSLFATSLPAHSIRHLKDSNLRSQWELP